MDSLTNVTDLDLTSVDTSRPLLEAGLVELTLVSITEKENKAHTGIVLAMEFCTNKEYKSTKGVPLRVGTQLFHNISLAETERYTLDMIKRNLASFQEGLLGKKGAFKPYEQYVGKTCTAKVSVETSEEYEPQNRIQRFVKKT